MSESQMSVREAVEVLSKALSIHASAESDAEIVETMRQMFLKLPDIFVENEDLKERIEAGREIATYGTWSEAFRQLREENEDLKKWLSAANEKLAVAQQKCFDMLPSNDTAEGVNAALAAFVKKKVLLGILWDYHRALDTRQHAGTAAGVLIHELETILETPWVRGTTESTPRP